MALNLGTPGASDYRRKLVEMLQQGALDTSPVQHWTQGANRMAQALLAGMEMRDQDRQSREANAAIASLLGGGQQAQPTTGGASIPSPTPMRVSQPPRIYDQNELNPMDPPSGADRDLMVRIIHGEAARESPEGQRAVASVIRNRAVSGGFGGDTVPGVITARNQFEPINTAEGRQRMAALDPNSPQYQQISQQIDQAYAGNDPTSGATHFFAPRAQAALGRPVPSWGQGPGQDIGAHRFFGGQPQPAAQPQAAPPAPQAGPVPQVPQQLAQSQPDMRAKAQEMLNSPNPQIRAMGQQLATQIITQQMRPDEWDIKTDDAGNTVAVNKRNPTQRMVLPAPQGLAESRAAQQAEIARQKEKAEARAKAEVALPEAVAQTDLALKTVEQIRNHPGRAWGVGTMAPVTGMIPGSDTRGFANLVEQARSQLFRQAFESLRGGGQISNIEGVKAENALARMDRAVSDREFETALNDYKDVLTAARQRMMNKAQGINEPQQPVGSTGSDGWQVLGPGIRIRERR